MASEEAGYAAERCESRKRSKYEAQPGVKTAQNLPKFPGLLGSRGGQLPDYSLKEIERHRGKKQGQDGADSSPFLYRDVEIYLRRYR